MLEPLFPRAKRPLPIPFAERTEAEIDPRLDVPGGPVQDGPIASARLGDPAEGQTEIRETNGASNGRRRGAPDQPTVEGLEKRESTSGPR